MSHKAPQSPPPSPAVKSVLAKLSSSRTAADQDVWQQMMDFALQSREQDVFKGFTSSVITGSYTDKGGLRKYRVRDEHGAEEVFERPSPRKANDIQTVPRFVEHSDRRPCDERAADTSLDISDRLDALRAWIAEEPDLAADFVASQLKVNLSDQSSEWLRIVIYAAEAIQFSSATLRLEVAESLLKHALRLRESASSEDSPVVMSAIRRAGSICADQHLDAFHDLLSGGTPIDTRLVTLQALSRRYGTVPPKESDSSSQVARRASTLAQKHWDIDVFKAGDISAIASEATLVAGQFGAQSAEDCVKLAKSTNRRYVVRKLMTRFKEIREHWLRHRADEAVARIDAMLALLR